MAYVAPTAADLKVRYPAFAGVADVTVESALAEAALRVDETWIEADFPVARMLYAAHVLTLDGQGTHKEAKFASLAVSGLTSIKSGSMTVALSESSARGETKKQKAGSLQGTSYGQRFLELLRVNKPAVVVLDGRY